MSSQPLNMEVGNCMNNYKIKNMMPFVPAKDIHLSSLFYEDLGFTKTINTGNSLKYELQGFGFWLQNYYVDIWADNSMLCIYVEDIHSWWARVVELDFQNRYHNTAKVLSEPHIQENILMFQITDPSGVLWHICEASDC
jgi:hypothetical protein